ncbi:hypothetical protein AAKU55_005062 [Oxalobacteraceae bacterium GrIS 1.11]
MSTKQERQATLSESFAAGVARFSHLMQGRQHLAAWNEGRGADAVAAKILDADNQRRGDTQ